MPDTAAVTRRVPALLGRAAEEASVVDLVEHLPGQGGALLVTGDPGIGKTALIHVARRAAHRCEVQLVTVTGAAAERHLAFAGLQRIVRPLADHLPALPEGQRRRLVRASEGEADEGAPPTPFVLGLALLELVVLAAQHRPLVVLVDDAHWLDPPTTEVLGFLGRRLEPEAAVLVLASREQSVPGPLLDLPALRLRPLEPDVSEALVHSVAPGLAAPLAHRVLELAGGNPLALHELARLASAGTYPEPQTAGGLDERLERVFGAESAALPDDTRMLLLAMAEADGGDLADAVVVTAALVGHAVDDEALAPARRAGLVAAREPDFTHPLVRSAVVAAATPAELRRVHTGWADHFSAVDPGRAAWHRAAATEGPDERIAHDLELAADLAANRGALAVAQKWLQTSADRSPLPDRARRLLRTGDMAFRLGRYADVQTVVTRLRSGPLSPAEADQLLWLEGTFDDDPSASPNAVEALVAGARRARDRGEPDLALTMLDGASRRCWWSGRTSVEVSAAADGLAEPDDPRVLVVHAHAATLSRGPAVLEAVRLRRDRPPSDPEDAARLTTAAFNLADFGHTLHFARLAVDGLRQQGQISGLAQMQVLSAWAALFVGRWELAYTAADEAYRLAVETRQPVWAAHARLGQADLEGRLGHAGRALELVADAERLAVSTGRASTLSGVEFVRGVIELGRWRPAAAYEHLRRSFDPGDRAHHPVERLWLLDHLSEAAAGADRRSEIQPIVDEIGATIAGVPSPGYHRAWRMARVHLAEDREVEDRIEEARSVPGPASPWFDARLDLAHGMALRRRRKISDARHLLRRAQVALDDLGAQGWAERARSELAAAGAPVTQPAPMAWRVLSPQELQIARLAAQGLTNREIGSQLYLSHRTVGSHLYRIFPKLGVTSRRQLERVLGREALD